jgi:tRNA-modifying protein YgfZ
MTALFELEGRGRIRASGEDRKRLLHAMTTNHVEQLAPGQGCYAFFLNANGRILADVHVLATEDSLLLDVEPASREFVLGHLDKYIIADDVTITDETADWTTLAVEGPDAAALLEAAGIPVPEADFASVPWAGRLVVKTSFTGQPGYWILVSPLDAPIVREAILGAGAAELTFEQADALRITHGKPRYGVDFSDAHLVQETQLMHAVHFQKGCYLGQEIVERVRSRGQVHRRLMALRVAGDAPIAPHTKVMAGDKEAGEITSATPVGDETAAIGILRAELLNGPLTADGRLVTPQAH